MKNILSAPITFVTRRKANIAMMFCLAVMSPLAAHASGTGTGLPWDGPLDIVKSSLTGPVAMAISVCALFACGAVLVFGGEMTEFVKRALYAVLAISFIVGGSGFMTSVFTVSGAVISDVNTIQPYIGAAVERVASLLPVLIASVA